MTCETEHHWEIVAVLVDNCSTHWVHENLKERKILNLIFWKWLRTKKHCFIKIPINARNSLRESLHLSKSVLAENFKKQEQLSAIYILPAIASSFTQSYLIFRQVYIYMCVCIFHIHIIFSIPYRYDILAFFTFCLTRSISTADLPFPNSTVLLHSSVSPIVVLPFSLGAWSASVDIKEKWCYL